MSARAMSRRRALKGLLVLGAGGAALSACGATPTAQVIEKVVTSVVEKEVTKIVEGTPQVVIETVVITEVQTQVVEQVVTATVAPKEPVKVIWADYLWGIELQQKLVDMFNEDHTDIVAEGQFSPWDSYWTKIQTQIAGGQVPDIIDLSMAYIVVLAFRNGLTAIDPFIERDGINMDDFVKTAVDQGRWEYGSIRTGSGKLWWWPNSAQTDHMFYYNKTMFDSEGIAYPDETWDWNRVVEVAKAMTKTSADGTTEQWGINLPVSTYMLWWPFTRQAGGDYFDAEMRKCQAGDEMSIAALTHVADFFQKDKTAPLPGSQQADPFLSGKVAMAYDGQWAGTITFQDIKDFDWDVALPPKGASGTVTTDVSGSGWAIMSGSKQAEASWEVCKWAVLGRGGEFSAQYINEGFGYKPWEAKYSYSQERAKPPLSLWKYADILYNSAYIPYVAASWAEFEAAGTAALQATVIGDMSPEAAAQDAVANTDAILADAWKKYV